ncbi:MAG: 5-(carboxyamino)imidazole ribonucleotide synthase [Gemmatimonadaceae bacterium]
MAPVLPGATIGFLGGGQLGRMAAMAARSMGYDVQVLDPDPDCPARPIASRVITARLDDADAAAELARGCDVITIEIEQIAVASIEAAARFAPVRPNAAVLHVVQDRARQKDWLASRGFPVAPYRTARSAGEVESAVAALGPSIAKTCTGGYDGRGQLRLAAADDGADAWRALGADHLVVERRIDIATELSVMVARRPGGQTAVFPAALNHHDHGVLTWSVVPAPIDPALERDAESLGRAVAESLGVEGLLAVEMFVTTDGALLVNELAPRPHNTFHATERGCATSQFEQCVRAACDLPLGDPAVIAPAAIINLLGDVWLGAAPPDLTRALQVPGVRLHLYGKRAARPGRKMGHLSAVGSSPDDAKRRVLDAYARLGGA